MDQFLTLSSIQVKREAARRAIENARAIIAEHEGMLRELEVAERIVKRFGTTTKPVFDHPKIEGSISQQPSLLKEIENKPIEARIRARIRYREPFDGELRGSPTEGFMLTVLKEKSDPWATANEIQEWASTLKGAEIPMSTISPVLTRLKNEGVIVREGLKVALAERLNEIGAPTAKRREPHTVHPGSTAGSDDADRKEAADAEA